MLINNNGHYVIYIFLVVDAINIVQKYDPDTRHCLRPFNSTAAGMVYNMVGLVADRQHQQLNEADQKPKIPNALICVCVFARQCALVLNSLIYP